MCVVSAVPNWGKLTKGMLKMYEGEVLSKLPVMQVREGGKKRLDYTILPMVHTMQGVAP